MESETKMVLSNLFDLFIMLYNVNVILLYELYIGFSIRRIGNKELFWICVYFIFYISIPCLCFFFSSVVIMTSKGRLVTRGAWTKALERLGVDKSLKLKGNLSLHSE